MEPINENLFLKVNIHRAFQAFPRNINVTWNLPYKIYKFSVGNDYLPVTLIYNQSGNLDINTPSDRFTLKGNSSLLLNENTPFEIIPEAGYKTDILFVYFSKKFLNELGPYYCMDFFEKVFVNDNVYGSVLRNLLKEFDEYCFDNHYLSEKFVEIGSRIIDNQHSIESELLKLKFKRRNVSRDNLKRLNKAIEFIEDSYNKEICIDDISREASISKYHLIRLFRKLKNTTPYNYLINTRLQRAKDMLLFSDANISEISSIVGYENITAFSNVFKRFTGISPREYRHKHLISKKAI